MGLSRWTRIITPRRAKIVALISCAALWAMLGPRTVAADEVRPARFLQRAAFLALRAPQALLAWLLAGSVSRPVPDLGGELEAAGLVVRSEQRWLLGSLAVFEAGRAA